MHTRKTFVVVALALVVGACQESAQTVAPAQNGPFTLAGAAVISNGERLARCAERLAVAHYAVKKQEYGDPWTEPDTYFSYQSGRQRLSVFLVGGNKTVDGAKTRVEARLPALRAVVTACEKIVGAPEGRLSENLAVSYVFTDRSKGELKTVITWEAGKFDLPPDDPAVPADLWIQTIP
mgnify:CR=1 FL=1